MGTEVRESECLEARHLVAGTTSMVVRPSSAGMATKASKSTKPDGVLGYTQSSCISPLEGSVYHMHVDGAQIIMTEKQQTYTTM